VDIKVLEKRGEEKKPAPPYTTDAMLKDASEKLRFSASKTMQLAQELFENGLCVTGDTEVVLKDGQIKPIGDIVEQSQEKELVAFKDRTFEVCCAEANKFWKIPYKGTLKVINLSNGLEIKTTPDHGLFVYRDGKFGWVSAKNLNRGDYVAVPFGYRKTKEREIGLLELLLELDITDVTLQFKECSKSFAKKVEPVIRKTVKSSVKYKYLRRRIVPLKVLLEGGLAKDEILSLEKDIAAVYHQRASSKPIPLFKLDEKFWYFVGLVLGDGSLSQKAKITIVQTPTKRVKEFLEELFPFLKISESSNGSVVIYSTLLKEILKKLGTRKGRLHPLIFTLKENYINALIAGYFDTDGTASLMFDKKVKKPSLRVAITSKRKEVLRKLHIYLNSVGILTTVRESKSRTAKDLIFSNLTIDRFTEKIGKHLRIRKEQLQKALEEYRKHHKKVFNGDILPFADLVKALHFPKGVKNKLLTEKGIDVWNYLKDNGKKEISRDRLKEIVKTLKVYGENEILRFLEHLTEQPLTWVKIENISEESFEGYLYDFTTSESSFIANGIVSHNCTYHRTDSTRVSDVGISIAREYIDENFGHDYFYPRHWGEGGAHECIRPTHPWDVEELRSMMLAGQLQRITKDHLRLYELIFKRFMASQMRPAEVEITKFEATPILEKEDLPQPKLEEEVITAILKDGFNLMTPIEVYYLKEETFKVVEQKEFTDEEGQKVEKHLNSAMKIYKLVPLAYPYTQGSLIEEMKKRGIGRPSTYAQIVQKLLDRGYVIERKNFLFPTKLGKEVYNYLIRLKEAEKFVKEEFTRILEELMDKIEQGEVYYIDVLKDLYYEVLKIEKLKAVG
jgi:reverse gyrase